MTEKNEKKKDIHNEKLDAMFKAASDDDWLPFDGFDERVIARIESEGSKSTTLDLLAWRFLPFAAAVSIVIAVIASTGESVEDVLYVSVSNPINIESIIALIGG